MQMQTVTVPAASSSLQVPQWGAGVGQLLFHLLYKLLFLQTLMLSQFLFCRRAA